MAIMLCSKCKEDHAVVNIPYSKQRLCRSCFSLSFESRIKRSVDEFKMFSEGRLVGVAVSGGKDSNSLIVALRRAYPKLNLKALHVNLGIKGYSDNCEEKAKKASEIADAEFHVYDIKDEEGLSVDLFKYTKYRNKVCSPCGVIKRRLFEVLAKRAGVDILATAHNLDDIVSIYLSGFFSGEFRYIARLGPVLPPIASGFPKKVKPMIRIPEREAALYAVYNSIPFKDVSCPHSGGNVESRYKKLINFMEQDDPGFKYEVLSLFLKKFIPLVKDEGETLTHCKRCGYPSTNEVCGYCRRIELLRGVRTSSTLQL